MFQYTKMLYTHSFRGKLVHFEFAALRAKNLRRARSYAYAYKFFLFPFAFLHSETLKASLLSQVRNTELNRLNIQTWH